MHALAYSSLVFSRLLFSLLLFSSLLFSSPLFSSLRDSFSPIVSELFIRDNNTRVIMVLLVFSLLWSITVQFLLVGTSLWIFGMAASYILLLL